MKKYYKYLFFLILGLACLIASTIIRSYSTKLTSSVNQVQELKNIQTNVTIALLEAEVDGAKIVKIISERNKLSFSALLQQTNYSYYIFKDNKLFFWSNNSFVPDATITDDTLKFSYLEIKQNKFLKYYLPCKSADNVAYKLYFLIPLYTKSNIQNDYVSSGFNKSIFNSKLETVITPSFSKEYIKAPNHNPLFSVFFNNSEYWISTHIEQITFVLMLCYLLSVIAFAGLWAHYFFCHKYYFLGLSVILLLILFLRITLLQYNFPFSVIAFDVFNSKYFASSVISPSLGDFLLNGIAIFVFVLYVYKYFFKLNIIKLILQISGYKKHLISFWLIMISQIIFGLVYTIFRIINQHSQWIFDITNTIQLNYFRYISLLVFLLISISFFCINHLLIRMYLALNKNDLKNYLIVATIASIATQLVFWGDKNFYWPLLVTNLIFIAIQYKLHMPRFLNKIKYSSYVYLIAVAMMCSLAGALAIYQINVERNNIDKNKFASQVLTGSDVLEEYLLHDINEKIKSDVFIRNAFTSPLSSKDLIFQKIRRVFLANYFEKFDIKISIYNQYGESFFADEDYLQYNDAVKKFAKKKYSTEYKNIFFINAADRQDLPRYVSFNKVEKNDVSVGYVLIQLTTKKIIPYSVFPELLIDRKYSSLNQPKSYSYAIFSKEEMKSNYGIVNYERDFSKSNLRNINLYTEGINISSLNHWGLKDNISGSVIVISSETYSWKRIFSNFSFLFIIFLLIITAYLLAFRIFSLQSNMLVSYASKIQLYLNLAFFLPLFVIALTTLSVIGSMYQNNLNNNFIKKAENIGNRISIFFEDFKKEKVKRESLNTFILQLSKYTESDINFYNTNGILVSSNQTNIYQKGLLSYYINPEALSEIKERKNNILMLTERIGNLNYHAVYIAVKAYDTGQLLGILSIPFFESRQELEKQIIEVFTIIINIFSSIFIVFLVLSYIVSEALTIPLKLITHSIKKTTFGDANEPIKWTSKDEIGLLIGEYNLMLQKLEFSKEALRSNEKESAWREMAQQVAHEIKNPLTPMKLTIQYLNKNILSKEDPLHEKISKGLLTILNQIETLNEIATSFSTFAKMPAPKHEIFEIFPLLQQSAQLFNNTVASITTVSLPTESSYINGDPQIMNGIFSNILLNAVQSIPSGRMPEIVIIGTINNQTISIEIRDNGIGIPKELHHKVFAPHFSTKYTGSGIGLALAKQGVEHIGGKIWFESESDVGTSFFIELPLVI